MYLFYVRMEATYGATSFKCPQYACSHRFLLPLSSPSNLSFTHLFLLVTRALDPPFLSHTSLHTHSRPFSYPSSPSPLHPCSPHPPQYPFYPFHRFYPFYQVQGLPTFLLPTFIKEDAETLCFFCANRRPSRTIFARYRATFEIELSPP